MLFKHNKYNLNQQINNYNKINLSYNNKEKKKKK